MLPITPFSLLCAVLLCLPLAVIFTLITPPATITTTATASIPATANSVVVNSSSLQEINYYPPEPINHKNHTTDGSTTTVHTSNNNSSTTATKTSTTIAEELHDHVMKSIIDEHDEEEDNSLFELASRIDPKPKPKPAKKVAFLFLTTVPLPFAPLWELYFTRGNNKLYNIYVHADPSMNYTASFSGVFSGRVIPSSKPTRRHTPTLISAARRLLAHALLHDASNSMFALISPSCIPIRSFDYTYGVLTRSKKSFIEILKDEPDAYGRWAARGEDSMLPEVKYEDFRIGSQFWVLTRRHASVVVRDKKLWSKFKLPCLRDDTCYPEEHYFPTLLNTVDPRGCTPCTLTHVDWKGSHGGHPRMYGPDEVRPEFIWALRNDRPRYGDEKSLVPGGGSHAHGNNITNNNSSTINTVVGRGRRRGQHDPFLFARKFSPDSLQRLLDIADDVVFKD